MRYQNFGFWTDSVPYRWSQRITSFTFSTLGKLEQYGNRHVPREGGVLLLSNHLSYIDPFVISSTATRELFFMARDNVFGIPLIGRFLSAHNAYPVKRGSADRAALKHTIALLQCGNAVLIFPEGTRSRDGTLGKARAGVSFIVDKANVPVIPLFIEGTDCVMPRGSRWIRPAKLWTKYGPPIDFTKIRQIEDKRVMYQCMGEKIMKSISNLAESNADS